MVAATWAARSRTSAVVVGVVRPQAREGHRLEELDGDRRGERERGVGDGRQPERRAHHDREDLDPQPPQPEDPGDALPP